MTAGRRETLWTIMDQALVSGANFLTGLLLARFLGIEGYGRYVLAYGILLFVAALQNALITLPMMVSGPGRGGAEARTYYTGTVALQVLVVVMLTVLVAIALGVAGLIAPQWQTGSLLIPLSLAIFAFMNQDFIRRYLFAQGRPRPALLNDAVSYLGQIAVLVWLASADALTVELALWAIAWSSLLATAHGAFVSLGDDWTFSADGFRVAAKENWEFGKWLAARSLTQWGGNQAVIYMAGAFLGLAAAGAIRAAGNILSLVNILFLAMENFVPPRASRLYVSQGMQKLLFYMRRVTVLGGAVTLAIVVVAVAFPEFWLRLVYGAEYAPYRYLIYWWGVYFIITFLHRPYAFTLRVLSGTRYIFMANLAGMVVILLLVGPGMVFAKTGGAMFAMVAGQVAILVGLILGTRRLVRA